VSWVVIERPFFVETGFYCSEQFAGLAAIFRITLRQH
jgi:hypothetical protein